MSLHAIASHFGDAGTIIGCVGSCVGLCGGAYGLYHRWRHRRDNERHEKIIADQDKKIINLTIQMGERPNRVSRESA